VLQAPASKFAGLEDAALCKQKVPLPGVSGSTQLRVVPIARLHLLDLVDAVAGQQVEHISEHVHWSIRVFFHTALARDVGVAPAEAHPPPRRQIHRQVLLLDKVGKHIK
jgi:hypothetical protein